MWHLVGVCALLTVSLSVDPVAAQPRIKERVAPGISVNPYGPPPGASPPPGIGVSPYGPPPGASPPPGIAVNPYGPPPGAGLPPSIAINPYGTYNPPPPPLIGACWIPNMGTCATDQPVGAPCGCQDQLGNNFFGRVVAQ
jgi:hypothetical protein